MPDERLFTRPFVLCSVANLAHGVSFSLFLHLPGYLNALGASDAQIGLVWSTTSIAAILVRRPLGPAMDTRGRRPVILLGGAINAVVCVLYASVTHLGPWLYGVRILHGISEAMLFTAFFTYAADCVPASRRTQGLALFGVSGMLPIALGGALGDQILAWSGFRALFFAASAIGALSLLMSLPLRDLPRSATEEAPSRGLWAAFRQPDLLPIWWMGAIFAIALA